MTSYHLSDPDECKKWDDFNQTGHTTFFSHFCNYLPFQNGFVIYYDNLKSPSHNHVLYQIWLDLIGWFLRMGKAIKTFTDRQTDDGQQVIRKVYLNI